MGDLGQSILSPAADPGRFGAAGPVGAIQISGAGDLIVASGSTPQQQGIIYCLNQGLQTLWQQAFDQTSLTSLALAGNGTTISVSAANNQVVFFARQSRLLWKQPTRSPSVRSAMSGNGNFLLAGTEEGNILFFDLARPANKFAWRKKFDQRL